MVAIAETFVSLFCLIDNFYEKRHLKEIVV